MPVQRSAIAAAVAALVAGVGLAPAGTANAATEMTTASVYASDDAYTSSTRRTTNFGKADKLVAYCAQNPKVRVMTAADAGPRSMWSPNVTSHFSPSKFSPSAAIRDSSATSWSRQP